MTIDPPHAPRTFANDRAFLCSFCDGLFLVVSPTGKHSVFIEDSDHFGPSKINPRNGDIIGMVPANMRWFWDWYPRWRNAGRPVDLEQSSPIGVIGKVRVPTQETA